MTTTTSSSTTSLTDAVAQKSQHQEKPKQITGRHPGKILHYIKSTKRKGANPSNLRPEEIRRLRETYHNLRSSLKALDIARKLVANPPKSDNYCDDPMKWYSSQSFTPLPDEMVKDILAPNH